MQSSSIVRLFLLRTFPAKAVAVFFVASAAIIIYFTRFESTQFQEKYDPRIIKNVRFAHFFPNYTTHCLSVSDISLPKDLDLYQMSMQTLSCLYQRHVASLQSLCNDPRRFGNVKYGGFRICVDEDVVPRSGCTIYSYNHALSERFINQMNSNFKCKVMFFGEKKVTNRGKLVDNVVTVLSRQSEEISVLILKLDYNDITHLNQLSHVIPKSKIRQIILEMHHTENTESGKKSSIVSYLSMLRQLNDSGYKIYWNDRNWEFVQKGNPTCFTVNLYLGNTNKPTISNKIDLPNLEPFGAMPMEKSEKQKYESIYWGYISHHQILCQTMVRVGNIVDGGWEVCHDVQFRPRSPCLVYSFGINYDFSFDEDVTKTYGCEVHAFDPSMNIPEFKRPHLKFYKIGIGEANKEITFKGQKWKLNTLKTILERLNHSNRRIDILKMDIEDNELQVLPEMIRSGAMRNVAQFYLEFHHYYDLGTLRQLHGLGFRIFWSHQNPQAEVYENNRSNSYGNDVYFVNINIPN